MFFRPSSNFIFFHKFIGGPRRGQAVVKQCPLYGTKKNHALLLFFLPLISHLQLRLSRLLLLSRRNGGAFKDLAFVFLDGL